MLSTLGELALVGQKDVDATSGKKVQVFVLRYARGST